MSHCGPVAPACAQGGYVGNCIVALAILIIIIAILGTGFGFGYGG
ncbi:hypothetical protein HM1_1616 [Heliomicrobium modesticaldum Ice1]|uniref:YjcZ family sporulation protein n=1 Tax=Heliobacterium modesticaldum (strain ATCC 51547 / Ice1) TaxID=498761 RepID=B0TDE5_HELMI|nr:hypothetical protein [Heliomicrobium modesticaldum]ABZ84186.1 hypothetical protein HM1_1616 [Heliomicrobium modesticaldum Ice1]